MSTPLLVVKYWFARIYKLLDRFCNLRAYAHGGVLIGLHLKFVKSLKLSIYKILKVDDFSNQAVRAF